MVVAESNDQQLDKKPKKSWVRWVVGLAFIAPMAGAYLIFKTGIGMPTGTVNQGDLLSPATLISELKVLDENGIDVELIKGKKWRMVMIGTNRCDASCQDLLYVSRQVHTRLNEKSVRVERIYFNIEANYSEEFSNLLKTDYPRLKRYSTSAQQWQVLFKDTNIADNSLSANQVYYVDQEGFAMMSYNAQHKGADLFKDIKRLLKYSYDERG